ncbi:MAG: asparagine synthase-related protein [Allopontixanthobacter sediminis]
MKPLRFVLAVPHRATGQSMPSFVEFPEHVCSPVPGLWCDSETPYNFPNHQCCIIGVAFSRTTFRRACAINDSVPYSDTVEAAARYLVANIWGGYFAILTDQSNDQFAILVDPSGLLPVYRLTTPEHVLLATDPLLFARVGASDPMISYPALHAHLLRPERRNRFTCLEGIVELAPGTLYFPAQSDLSARAIWRPAAFFPKLPATAFEDAAEQLKEIATAVMRSWSETYGLQSVAVSGGVDSSLICAALARSSQRFGCITLATSDPTGDERVYARQVARWFGAGCIERMYEPTLYDPFRPSSRGLVRPARRSFQHVLDTLLIDAMEDLGASVVYDGNGGDNLFCFLHSSAPVTDRLAAEGMGTGALRTLIDMCRITGCSVPTMLAAVFRRWLGNRKRESWSANESLLIRSSETAICEPAVPWLSDAVQPGSGKRDHLVLMMRAQNHIHNLAAGLPRFSPLASQPLVEFCLGVPTWVWAHGGRNRALARAAFAQDLPPAVMARTSKAGPDSFVRQVFAQNRAAIGERLLDGLLAAHGVIDRHAVEEALGTDETNDNSIFDRVLDLLEAENWARSWTR